MTRIKTTHVGPLPRSQDVDDHDIAYAKPSALSEGAVLVT